LPNFNHLCDQINPKSRSTITWRKEEKEERGKNCLFFGDKGLACGKEEKRKNRNATPGKRKGKEERRKVLRAFLPLKEKRGKGEKRGGEQRSKTLLLRVKHRNVVTERKKGRKGRGRDSLPKRLTLYLSNGGGGGGEAPKIRHFKGEKKGGKKERPNLHLFFSVFARR